MAKIPEIDDDNIAISRRTIQLASVIVIINKRITAPVAIDFRSN